MRRMLAPFFVCSLGSALLTMLLLLRRIAAAEQDHTGRSVLYAAVEIKDPSLAIIDALLKAGANPNLQDISQTPMAVFPLCRTAKKVSAQSSGVTLEAPSLLHLSRSLAVCVVLFQSTSVLALLVRYGLNPSLHVSDTGQTLIDFAVEAGARAESLALLEEAKEMRAQRAASAEGMSPQRVQPGASITKSIHNGGAVAGKRTSRLDLL